MKLEDYKAWLLEHGEIKEEYERPYNPQCDPPEYKDGSYFLSYDLMYAGRPYAVGDVTALACYKYVYNESKAYLKERLKYEVCGTEWRLWWSHLSENRRLFFYG